jgi:hypothetical protein
MTPEQVVKIQRPDFGYLEIRVTVEDPKAYTNHRHARARAVRPGNVAMLGRLTD